MTEQERYAIEKDVVNEKLCIWDYDDLICEIDDDKTLITLVNLLNKLNEENEELKQVNKKILDTINNKITEKDMDWYKAEDNSKEEKEANLQLNVLEEVKEEIIKTMEE